MKTSAGKVPADPKATYVTTYCNKAHRLVDGQPVDHECNVLPPEALQLEREDRYAEAIAVLEKSKPLKISQGARSPRSRD